MSRILPWDMPPRGLEIDGFLDSHDTFQERMVARLGTYVPDPQPDDGGGLPLHDGKSPAPPGAGRDRAPLAGLAGKTDDPAVMLLDAWATALDVLAFYQRRLLAEGFVSTAVADRSVHDLAGSVAVDVGPAVSASVVLCFTVSDGAPGPVKVPRLTAVQSVPGSGGGLAAGIRGPKRTDVAPPLTVPVSLPSATPGTMPQVFETSADLSARAEWNQMALVASADPDRGAVTGDAVGILAKGGSYGVEPGDALIFTAPAFAAARTVLQIGKARARGCTLFLWSPGAPLERGAGAIDGLQVFTSRTEEPLFGSDAPAWSELSLPQRAALAPMVGGLQRFDETKGWQNVEQHAPAGFPEHGRVPVGQVLCLASAPGGALLAGVYTRGLLRRPNEDTAWAAVLGIASRIDATCLACDAAGRIYAGTTKGVFRSADQGKTFEPLTGGGVAPASTDKPQYAYYRFPATPVRAIAVVGSTVIAGTDDGALRWDPAARIWPTMNDGLQPDAATNRSAAIRALVVDATKKLVYAGTDRGLFVCRTDGIEKQAWRPCDATSAAFDVTALAIDGRGVLFAGLDAPGGLAIRGTGGTWTRAAAFTDVTVRALAVAADVPDAPIFAGTSHGVFCSKDGGLSFELLDVTGASLGNPDVTAMAVSPDGTVVAATPFAGVEDAGGGEPAWPLQDGTIELTRTTHRIAAGDRVVLAQDSGSGGAPGSVLLQVLGVTTVQRDGLGRARQVTALTVDGRIPLSGFDRRRATLCVAGTEIPLFGQQVRDLDAIASTDVTLDDHLANDTDFAELTRGKTVVSPPDPLALVLDGVIPDLAGRRVVVAGRSLRARALEACTLTPADARSAEPVAIVAGEVLDVLAMPEGSGPWKLRTRLDVEGTVDATAELTLLPAADDADTVAQVRTVTSSEGVPLPGLRPATRIVLGAKLSGMLDPATVTVRANVVDATHGRTVSPQEVMGVADGSANLQLTLKNKPLTWTTDGGEISPALAVWVGKHLWTRVDTFSGAGPDSLVYAVKTTSDGASVVCFGDGVRGRRPPAESELVADYRYGAGVTGNVDAGRITMIRQRPLGVTAVANPLPSSGGADAQPLAELRRRAPLATRALDRIVSLRDCQDMVATLPGIARACVTRVSTPRGEVLFVTVATADEAAGYALDPASAAYRDLTKRLATVHGAAVGSCVVRYFPVGAVLTLDPGAPLDATKAAARAALTSAFGFEHRDLHKDVATSEIVATLTKVAGVRGVRVNAPPGPRLAASDARWKKQAVVPAELLLINAQGITIDVEAAG